MKLFEFVEDRIGEDKDKLPYDVVEDIHFHMISDDAFYRKHYLPCMDSLGEDGMDEEKVMPMVHKCVNHYCNKYDINKDPKDLLSNEEKADLVQRVLDYERNPPEGDNGAFKTNI